MRIGALVPLSPPGWAAAGRHLLAGLELAAAEHGVELLVRDTAGDPARAQAAVDELAALGVEALAGEYHSVVARAVAARAHALGLRYLCSSAVIDELTDEPSDVVARIAPEQSRGWALYADFLRAEGHERIAVAAQPSVYWQAGTRILRRHLDVTPVDPADVRLGDATALLLLVGTPEPATSIVEAVRRTSDVLIGAPAGQPELPEWHRRLGADGAGVPFLRYLPPRLGPLGTRVHAELHRRLGEPPSFVGLEGYDAITVLATGEPWADVDVEGTRGRIRFTRQHVWQWTGAPLQVADRDPRAPDRFRVRYT